MFREARFAIGAYPNVIMADGTAALSQLPLAGEKKACISEREAGGKVKLAV